MIGNITAFLDNLMNNVLYRERYDVFSDHVVARLNAMSCLPKDILGLNAKIGRISQSWLVLFGHLKTYKNDK